MATSGKKKRQKQPAKARHIGPIHDQRVGKRYADRWDAMKVHRQHVAGIHGTIKGGAESVVLNGHPEDRDHGETFMYVGCGGGISGARTGRQVSHQSWATWQNRALRTSALKNTPVRVLRGSRLKSCWAPSSGFWYSGTYTVSNPRIEPNSDGLDQCRFDFTRCGGQPPLPVELLPDLPPTDIEVRRRMWKEARAKAGESSGVRNLKDVRANPKTPPGGSTSGPSVPATSKSRGKPQEVERNIFAEPTPERLLAKFRTHINRLAKTTPDDSQHRTDLIRIIGTGITRVIRERAWELPWTSSRPASALFRGSAPSSASTSPLFNAGIPLPPEELSGSPPPASVVSSEAYSPLSTPGELPEEEAGEVKRWSRTLWAYVASCLSNDLAAMDGTALEAWYLRENHGETD